MVFRSIHEKKIVPTMKLKMKNEKLPVLRARKDE